MGQPAARITDMHTCPMFDGPKPHVGGPIIPPCAVTVLTGGLPQARITDMAICVGPPDTIMKGSATVHVCGLPAARMFDMTMHGGVIVTGCPTVLIGDAGGGGGGGGGGGALTTGASFADPAAQAKAFIGAAKEGAPFSNRPKAESKQSVTEERKQTAMNFFEQDMGLSHDEALQMLKGVDLNQPVEVVDIPPPETMTQFVRKSWGRPGNWFNPDPNQSAEMLGLNGDPPFAK